MAYLLERAQNFPVQCNVRSLASYAAGIAAVVACAVVISITIYQQPATTPLAVQNSPVPSTPRANAQREPHLLPPAMLRTFNAERILLPRSRDIPLRPLLPADPIWSDEIRLKPKWESLDDLPLLEK